MAEHDLGSSEFMRNGNFFQGAELPDSEKENEIGNIWTRSVFTRMLS